MNALISFLLLFFAIIFWGFRVIVCLMNSMQLEFFAVPYNSGFEIAMLFVSVLCFVLIVKRNLIGATIYLGLAFAYFGSSLYERFVAGADLSIISGSEVLLEVIGILIPLCIFFDILFNKNKFNFAEARKTEWYYGNDKFDRQYDERADRNHYKM